MSKRIKLTQPALKTRAEMEVVMAEIRADTLERNSLVLQSESAKKAIDDKFGPLLTVVNKRLDERMELVGAWANANITEFNGLRTLTTPHGDLGWRFGNVTLKTLAGFTWDRVLEKMQSLARFSGYIRTKAEVNKAALLLDRDNIPADEMRAIGVRAVQEEVFFVEPNIEQPENRQTVVA